MVHIDIECPISVERGGVVVKTLVQKARHDLDTTGSIPVAGSHTTHRRVAALAGQAVYLHCIGGVWPSFTCALIVCVSRAVCHGFT